MSKKSFRISSEIYNEEMIFETIAQFDGFKVSYTDNQLTIEGENEQDIEQIFNEFMNYCLALHNEQI